MKNIKKIITIMLSLAMVLGCLQAAFAESGASSEDDGIMLISLTDETDGIYKDVSADAVYSAAVADLTEKGILNGYDDGCFHAERTVTRAEMAKLIAAAFSYELTGAANSFTDVPSTNWAYAYVNAAAAKGIINGYGNGEFKPSQTVSYDEAIKMLVSALGYSLEDLGGTYPSAFTAKAKELGLLDTVSATGSAGANRGDIAILLNDTLKAKTNASSKTDSEDQSESTDASSGTLKTGSYPYKYDYALYAGDTYALTGSTYGVEVLPVSYKTTYQCNMDNNSSTLLKPEDGIMRLRINIRGVLKSVSADLGSHAEKNVIAPNASTYIESLKIRSGEMIIETSGTPIAEDTMIHRYNGEDDGAMVTLDTDHLCIYKWNEDENKYEMKTASDIRISKTTLLDRTIMLYDLLGEDQVCDAIVIY